jgi:hypothetical protein
MIQSSFWRVGEMAVPAIQSSVEARLQCVVQKLLGAATGAEKRKYHPPWHLDVSDACSKGEKGNKSSSKGKK